MTLSAIFYGAGYLTGLIAFVLMARSRRLLTDGVMTLLAIALLGGLVFAIAAQRLIGGTAGKTVLGGIVGGYLCVAIGKRAMGIRRPLGDLFAVAISAGEAVGRLGCFFGGCCYGKACYLPWAVYQHGLMRHPTQIYLSLGNLAVLGVLLKYNSGRPPENTLFYLQGTLYCIVRFVIEFLRDTPPPVMGLSSAQWACVAGLLYFGYWLCKSLRSGLPKTGSSAPPA